MWPKFSNNKDEKPPLKLHLEPLTGLENGTPFRKRENNSKFIIFIKLLVVIFCTVFFSAALYYLLLHMAYCSRNESIFQDPTDPKTFYDQFYDKYVAPIAGQDERNNDFYKNIYIKIYDGEYEVPDNLEDYSQRYKNFLKKYGKVYPPSEKEYRFRVYVHNVIEYEKEESKTPWIDYDDTFFTDLTDSELKNMLTSGGGYPSFEGTSRFEDKFFENEARPLQVDWRLKGKVTDIKNQQQCGSCWAFAVVAAIESQYAIKKNSTVHLSEQQLVDCDNKNNGCHGGYRPYAMSYVMKNGLYPDNMYPYLATEHNQCKMLNFTKVFINDYKVLSQNEETQADWIAQNGPVTFGMKVIKQMYNYRNGIFEPSREDCEEHSLGSHAMTIIGYGSENGRDYWIVKNSWGALWGQAGFFKLARGVNACGAAENVVAPIIN